MTTIKKDTDIFLEGGGGVDRMNYYQEVEAITKMQQDVSASNRLTVQTLQIIDV